MASGETTEVPGQSFLFAERTLELLLRAGEASASSALFSEWMASELEAVGVFIRNKAGFRITTNRIWAEKAGSVWLSYLTTDTVQFPPDFSWPHHTRLGEYRGEEGPEPVALAALREAAIGAGVGSTNAFTVWLTDRYGLRDTRALTVLERAREIWSGARGLFVPMSCAIESPEMLAEIAAVGERGRVHYAGQSAKSIFRSEAAVGCLVLIAVVVAAVWFAIEQPGGLLRMVLSVVVVAVAFGLIAAVRGSERAGWPMAGVVVGALLVLGTIWGAGEQEPQPAQPKEAEIPPSVSGFANAVCADLDSGASQEDIVQGMIGTAGVSRSQAESIVSDAAGMC